MPEPVSAAGLAPGGRWSAALLSGLLACVLPWLLMVPVPALAQATQPAGPVDLLGIWQQARSADPQLAAADARRGVQREAAVQARAALLPQWQLSASALQARAGGDTGRSHELASNLNQVLFDLGRLRTLDAERQLESAEEAWVRGAEQALAARVARAYFGVLSAQAALATAQVNEAAYARQVEQSQSRFEAGLAAQVDVEQSRTYHALARGNTVQAQQGQADALAALAEITGQPPGPLRPLAAELPALPPQPLDVQAWIDQALQANPRLLALGLGVQAGDSRIAAARAAHLPALDANLDTRRTGGPGSAAVDRGQSHSLLTLRLTVPLFAGGATASGVRQARHLRALLREELEAERRALQRETRAQHQAVLAGVQLLQSSRAAVDAADRALAATRTGQSLGTRSNTDLLLAIQTQASARAAHDRARHDYVLARLLLQQAAGSLGTAELAAANTLLEGAR